MARGTKEYPDFMLLSVFAFLVVAGILILASVSSTLAYESFKDPFYFIKHQVIFGLIPALVVAFIFFKINLSFLKKWSFVLFLVNLICLGLVLIPGIGVNHGGATRWLDLRIFSFQPSELLKFTFLIYLAAWLESKIQDDGTSNITPIKHSRKIPSRHWMLSVPSLVIFLTLFVLVGFFLYKQPDLGTFAIVSAIVIIMYFAANTPFWHSVFIVLSGAGA